MPGVLTGTEILLDTIRHEAINHNPNTSVSQENARALTSYNLMPPKPHSARAIHVPGSPAIWTPKSLPLTLLPDKGRFLIDPNRNAFPKCPLEPAFRALDLACPTLRMSDFDLITDRRNLRRLFAFAGGSTQELRIDAESVGRTVLFSCWTRAKTHRWANGTPTAGYGTNFERSFTEYPQSSRNTVIHNRIITYTLGGVRLLVRFEVDGRLISASPVTDGRSEKYVAPTGMQVISSGSFAPSENIVEIKTGSSRKKLDTGKNLAQLWISMTPILISGVYEEKGTFTTLRQQDVSQDGTLNRWEQGNKEKLQKLVRLIEMITERLISSSPTKQALVVRKGGSELEFYRLATQYAPELPLDIRTRWTAAATS